MIEFRKKAVQLASLMSVFFYARIVLQMRCISWQKVCRPMVLQQ